MHSSESEDPLLVSDFFLANFRPIAGLHENSEKQLTQRILVSTSVLIAPKRHKSPAVQHSIPILCGYGGIQYQLFIT